MDENLDFLITWLKEQMIKAKAEGLIVGVSGGVDSALVSYLIKKAAGDNSIGAIMPCSSNPKDKKDALLVVEKFNINYIDVDLTDIHDMLSKAVMNKINKETEEKYKNNAEINSKARLRMTTLYYLANYFNYLVIGTDNAAELFTGYFTKYGDGGVDLLPIANLTKRQVREYAKKVGVPIQIINKPPSAGLWDGQTDEKEMGITYDLIDNYLEDKEIPEKYNKIIEKMHNSTMHKRSLPPIPPKYNNNRF